MFDAFREKLAGAISPKSVPKTDMVQTPGSAFLGPSVGGGYAPRLGTKELLTAYSMMPWLRAAVNKVGQSVGNTTWKLFVARNRRDGEAVRAFKMQRAGMEVRQELILKEMQKGDLEEIDDHPLLTLLQEGNPRLLGQSVFQLTQEHFDLTGEAFWLLEKNVFNVPVATWPLPPDWVVEFPVAGRPTYKVKIGAITYDIPVSEIVPFIDPDPANPYGRGVGTAKSLGDELETDEYTAKHLRGFFKNRARPDIIISADGLSREETRRLEERWKDEFKGFWNSYKANFMNRKVSVTEIGQSFENMQMVDLRKFERDIVLQVYGFPPEKFGILSSSNRSTIVAADLFWTKDIVMPRVELLRNVLQKHLIPMFDERLILDFDSPVMQDKDHQLNVMSAAPAAFTLNEWRDEADRESLGEEGEKFIVRSGEGLRNPDGTIEFPTPVQPDSAPPEDPEDDTPENQPNDEIEEDSIDSLLTKHVEEIKSKTLEVVRQRFEEKMD